MAKDGWRYGVVLDAGSSGTRVYVYRWLKNTVARLEVAAGHLPGLETKNKWTKKAHPGVSTFAESPDIVGSDHLQPLLDHALRYVPEGAVPDTPIFLLATAGVRLLPERQRNNLLKNICSYFKTNTGFLISDCDVHVQVIPGETEGLYGWVAANYLLGGFDAAEEHQHGKGHHTYGFLDMGGASAQIAFAPNATEAEKHANDLKLLRLRTIDGTAQEYKVFVTTWLGFGVNEARRRYVKGLVDSFGGADRTELPDPCLPSGIKLTVEGEAIGADNTAALDQLHLIGTGKFDECLRRTFPLLEKEAPCLDEPCLFNGIHVPAIDFDVNHFIGISEYWHTTHEVFEMAHRDKAYDFNTYQNGVNDFCSQDWSVIQAGVANKSWGKKVTEQTAYEVCFKGSWLINMLHDGIGIPRVGIEGTPPTSHNGTKDVLQNGKEKGFLDPFQAVKDIKSTEVSWTLGKMVLYASADVPATEDALPVGFGANEPGVPADFQYPGGGRLQSVPDSETTPSQSLTDKLHDSVFKSDAPHRIPGFIFFVLIVLIAVFYLLGRERRTRFYNRTIPSSLHSKVPGISFLNHLLGRKDTHSYDRVLEDGANTRLYDAEDVELADMDDDDADEAKMKGRGSGWNSPRRKPLAGRLTPDVLNRDRRGMMIRTESRERISIKSRSGSPTSKGRS